MTDLNITGHVLSKTIRINDDFKLESTYTSDSEHAVVELIPTTGNIDLNDVEREELQTLLENGENLILEEEKLFFIFNDEEYKLFLIHILAEGQPSIIATNKDSSPIEDAPFVARLFDHAIQYMNNIPPPKISEKIV